MSRDFGGFRQGLFFKLEQIIASHGAKLAYPTHVSERVLVSYKLSLGSTVQAESQLACSAACPRPGML